MPVDPVLPHYHTPTTPSLYTTTCQFPSNLLTPHIYNPTVPSLKWKKCIYGSINQSYIKCSSLLYNTTYCVRRQINDFIIIIIIITTKALRPSLLQSQRHWGPVCFNHKDTEAQFAATAKTLRPSLLQPQRHWCPVCCNGKGCCNLLMWKDVFGSPERLVFHPTITIQLPCFAYIRHK